MGWKDWRFAIIPLLVGSIVGVLILGREFLIIPFCASFLMLPVVGLAAAKRSGLKYRIETSKKIQGLKSDAHSIFWDIILMNGMTAMLAILPLYAWGSDSWPVIAAVVYMVMVWLAFFSGIAEYLNNSSLHPQTPPRSDIQELDSDPSN